MKITKSRIIPFIQISMAAIYILFWSLKLIWWSPAEDLVFQSISQSIPFMWFSWFYPFLWSWEVLLWLLFLHLWLFRKFGFWLFMIHMMGTFLPFITTTDLCLWICKAWDIYHPTFTIVWQYILKNVSMISCGLVLMYTQTISKEEKN